MEKPPQYQQPPLDPQFLALQQQAQNDQIAATQQTVQMDSASLMARYGTRLALANAAGGGGATATPASPLIPAAVGAGR
jgi:hypothetical protein